MKNQLLGGVLTLACLCYVPTLLAQHIGATAAKDTNSLAYKLRHGHFSGQIRTFAMATTNDGALSDFHALAAGGGLRYETPILFKHFQFEMDGMFIFNLKSSDLGAKDPITAGRDRYEIALFDVEDADNKTDLDRMDAFNMSVYLDDKNHFTLGRQIINTPFMNAQDGRMRPSLVSGIFAESKALPRTTLLGGWLWAAAPRATVRWFSVAESIGVYPMGVNPDGTRSNYAGHLESAGIGILGIEHQINSTVKGQFWNYMLENINNTAYLQLDGGRPLSMPAQKWHWGLQVVRQDALNDGGHADPQKAYVAKGSHTWIFGGRIGWSAPDRQFFLNSTRITADGRFTFPREWGREPLYTFMQRERNEGLADVWAFTATYGQSFLHKKLQTKIGLGYYDLPDVRHYAHNKYGLPSYVQLNLSLKYTFGHYFKGLEGEILIAHKWNQGEHYDDNRYIFNKVNMTNYNAVLNYKF